MRRVVLAGVGLTLTACGFSVAPPSSPTASKPAAQPETYVSALADTQQCTLWREVAGQRQCLDGAQAAVQPPASVPGTALKAPAPAAAPRLAVTSQPLDAPPAATPAAPVSHPADLAIADMKPTGPNLFEEMRKLGMIKPGAGENAAPGFVAGAPADRSPAAVPAGNAPALPSLPTARQPMLAATPAPVSNVSAFADTAPKAAPAPARPAAPAVSSVVSQSWAPVEPPKSAEARVQLAASTPGVQELQEKSPVTAVQRAPVEKAELPTVRSNAVVPLKITQKATEETPAVVEPAVALFPASSALARVPVAGRQVAQANAPALPSLPALPPLPSASSAPAPVTTSPAPVSKPVTLAAPALPSAPAPVASSNSLPSVPPASTGWSTTTKVTHAATSAPAPASAPASAKVIPAAAPARATTAKAAPAKAATAPAAGKYLVLQSFQERDRADRLASRYSGLDARVASVSIKGQTWHRVVVRDGASTRRQLASDGVRGFWPTSL